MDVKKDTEEQRGAEQEFLTQGVNETGNPRFRMMSLRACRTENPFCSSKLEQTALKRG